MGKVGEDLQYQEVRDKVVAVAGHKAKVRVPLPREEGGIHEVENWSWGGIGLGEDEDWCGGEVDALGKGSAGTKCHRCGGLGHFARECGTPAGTMDVGGGKGGLGKGSAKGGFGAPWRGWIKSIRSADVPNHVVSIALEKAETESHANRFAASTSVKETMPGIT